MPAMATKLPLFCFLSSSAVFPHLGAPFLSLDFLVFLSRLSPHRHRLTTMLPASFSSKPHSSPTSGLQGLCRNITAIRLTPPPPAVGSFLGRASVLSRCMGEGLLSKFSGQASGKWSICLSRFLIVANAHGLRGVFGGTPLPWHAQIFLGVTIKRERGRSGGINKFKLTTVD